MSEVPKKPALGTRLKRFKFLWDGRLKVFVEYSDNLSREGPPTPFPPASAPCDRCEQCQPERLTFGREVRVFPRCDLPPGDQARFGGWE